MDNERIRELCLALPYAAETLNWGHHLCYWAGNRELGGKMFAITDVDGAGKAVLMFHCGAERYWELVEREGIFPAPHLARAHWVAVEHWNALREREYAEELRAAHGLIYAKLAKRTRTLLEGLADSAAQPAGKSAEPAAKAARPKTPRKAAAKTP